MDFSAVNTFIQDNLIPAKPGRRCISGRYNNKETSSGMIARPGADLGYVIAMLGYNYEQKLGMSVQECVDSIYKAIIKIGGNFYLHTDKNEDPNAAFSIGCSHVLNSAIEENASRYGVSPQDVQEAVKQLRNNPDNPTEVETLDGPHDEAGFLIINDKEHTLNSKDDSQMYFIYDKKRDDLFMKQLIEELNMDNVVYEDFQRIATMQLSITLQIIAKDLPIFEVNLYDPANPRADHIGTV